jgi:hypothetical protein
LWPKNGARNAITRTKNKGLEPPADFCNGLKALEEYPLENMQKIKGKKSFIRSLQK